MKTTLNLREELNVSNATISNWLKTGVIPPYPNGRYFEVATYFEVIESIKNDYSKLQKRANRSKNEVITVKTSTITKDSTKNLIDNLQDSFQKSGLSLSEFMCELSVFLLVKKELIQFENGKITSENLDFTIFLENWKTKKTENLINLFDIFNEIDFPTNETDFLGSTYESLRSLGEKAISGAFYTPKIIIEDLDIPLNCSVLDPCAGTGTFLLNTIKKAHNPKLITLRDIDETALRIAKVNFALFFGQIHTLVHTEIENILNLKSHGKLVEVFRFYCNKSALRREIITN